MSINTDNMTSHVTAYLTCVACNARSVLCRVSQEHFLNHLEVATCPCGHGSDIAASDDTFLVTEQHAVPAPGELPEDYRG